MPIAQDMREGRELRASLAPFSRLRGDGLYLHFAVHHRAGETTIDGEPLPRFFPHSLGQNAVIRPLFFRSQIGPLNNDYFAFF